MDGCVLPAPLDRTVHAGIALIDHVSQHETMSVDQSPRVRRLGAFYAPEEFLCDQDRKIS